MGWCGGKEAVEKYGRDWDCDETDWALRCLGGKEGSRSWSVKIAKMEELGAEGRGDGVVLVQDVAKQRRLEARKPWPKRQRQT
jgi:hypothetical protein